MVKKRKRAAEIMDRTICPCCGKHHFTYQDFFEICPVCGWEDDPIQRMEPDYEGGANRVSLNQAREAFKKGERY